MRLNVRTACRQSSDSGLDRDAQKNRSVSLSDLFEAYLSSKPNLSHIHQDQIRYVLERLRKANLAALAVSEIEPSKLEPVLSEMKGGTKNRYLRILRAAFNYAIKHDWMKANPTDKLDFASIPKRSIRIFSNRQIEDMLRYSAEHHIDMLPYFALGAGLRVGSGELSKMEWSDIHWEEKTIVVRPEISKTGKRRLIPLCDALNSWLTLYLEKRKVTSRRIITIPYGTLRKLRSRIFEAVSPNSRWIAAGLRHSFCSASINAEKGIDATCLSMGYQGSPTILYNHYYACTSKADALAYWEIAVNEWIRSSGAFDGVIDFDAATRDPDHPAHILAKFDSGDHLHPQDDGYKAMADSIDLKMLTTKP